MFYICPIKIKQSITMENLIKNYESLLEQYTEFTKDSDRNTHYDFLCNFIEKKMIINEEDRNNLFSHFKTQRPTYNGYRKIYLNEFCNTDKKQIVWFSSHRHFGKQIRIRFLKEIIKKLNKNLEIQNNKITFDLSKLNEDE